MKKTFFIFLSLFLISCGQDYNSNSGDEGQYSSNGSIDTSTPDGVRLAAVYTILQSKCFQCHSGWTSYTTSAQWESAGLIVKGSAANSELVRSLKNYGGDMPPDPQSPLTTEQVTVFETWIDNYL